MMTVEPKGTGLQRWASLGLAFGLLGLEFLWAAACALALAMVRLQLLGWAGAMLPALGVGLNTWAWARAVKNAHFLWLYSRWTVPDGGSEALKQAVRAYADNDLERVLVLAGKEAPAADGEALRGGAARSLALLGRMEEAATAFAAEPGAEERLRWLRPRRAWGRERPPYFKTADAAWGRRQFWLIVFASLSISSCFELMGWMSDLRQPRGGRHFDSERFESIERGPFVIHYHDAAAAVDLADVIEKALSTELAFLDRSDALIPDGSYQLYLCDSREEYRQRAPAAPIWEQAATEPATGRVYLFKLPPADHIYFEIVVAHELSHLLYHRFFPVRFNDAWLNEGLADYQGYAFALDRAGFARQAWLQNRRFAGLAQRSLPFSSFFLINPYQLKTPEEVGTFYTQGFSLVFMLVEHYGQKNFLRFLDAYREQNGDAAKALALTYPTIQNTDQLAAVWGLFYGKGN
jgi:hypothetical protein